MKFFFLTAALVATLGEASAINATTLKSNIMDQVNNMNAPQVKTGSSYVKCTTMRSIHRTSNLYVCTTLAPYGNNEHSTIEISGAGLLEFVSFGTEANYDKVMISWGRNGHATGSQSYSGSTKPPPRSISAGETVNVVWSSDSTVVARGWTFKFAPAAVSASASSAKGCSPCAPGLCTHNCPYVNRIACSPGLTDSCTHLNAGEKKSLAFTRGFLSYSEYESHESRWGWPQPCESKLHTGYMSPFPPYTNEWLKCYELAQWYGGSAASGSYTKSLGAVKSREEYCCTGLWDAQGKDTALGICAALGCDIEHKEAIYAMCNAQPCTDRAGKALVQATPFMQYTNHGEDKVPETFQANKANCCSISGRCARWGCKISKHPRIWGGKGYKEIQTACDSIYPTCRMLQSKGKFQLEWLFQHED